MYEGRALRIGLPGNSSTATASVFVKVDNGTEEGDSSKANGIEFSVTVLDQTSEDEQGDIIQFET